MFDDRDIARQLAELVEKLDTIDEKLDGIVSRIERIEEQLGDGDQGIDSVVSKRSVPLPLPGDPFDISDAILEAIRETGATSYSDMGRVIKAARGRLRRKGKQFKESELLSSVREMHLFQQKPFPKDAQG